MRDLLLESSVLLEAKNFDLSSLSHRGLAMLGDIEDWAFSNGYIRQHQGFNPATSLPPRELKRARDLVDEWIYAVGYSGKPLPKEAKTLARKLGMSGVLRLYRGGKKDGAIHEWKNKRNRDGTYNVKFDDGRKFKHARWRHVAGHNALITKKGKVQGLPKAAVQALSGGGEELDVDDLKRERQLVKSVSKKVDSDPSGALRALEDEDDLPVTKESAKGGGLTALIGKLVKKLGSAFSSARTKLGTLQKKRASKKALRKAKKETEKALAEKKRADALEASYAKEVEEKFPKARKAQPRKAKKKARKAEKAAKKAEKARKRLARETERLTKVGA